MNLEKILRIHFGQYEGAWIVYYDGNEQKLLWNAEKIGREAPTQEELEAWNAELPSPLDEAKAAKVSEINATTSRLILAGFNYSVNDVTYHFGYDADDQGNFTKATLAATLSIIGKQPFTQPWRGWKDGEPHTLTLDAQNMIALATFAGVDHQQGLLQSGWTLTARVQSAQTIEEVEAIVDDRE